jgi:hypothetical protein
MLRLVESCTLIRSREPNRTYYQMLGISSEESRTPDKRDTPVRLRRISAPSAPREETLALLIEDGGNCDVKLVYRKRAL